ncbi:hypothetical protein [Salibacterium lacus]|uniref:Uncharacterized protein n=1 Tax=Salibacterium lacus TaxID=1898109 RepID=A0ABW5SWU5_9BACI
MAEIKSAGYQAIRDFIQSNWTYIEIKDDSDTAVLRVSPSDSRVSWIHTAGNQTLQIQIVVKGSDSDISIPQTFALSAIFDTESGGTAYSEESFTAFTMESEEDEITVVHSIQVPQV